MYSIKDSINELHKGFSFLNDAFYDGFLPEPAILIQNQGNRRDVLGWCTSKEVWTDKEGLVKKYEINITAEYLNRDYFEVMETLLHETVHLYNAVNGVQDCSRGGSYHNKKFKQEAERRGLNVTFSKGNGWAYTTLKEDSWKIIDSFSINRDAFSLARKFNDSNAKRPTSIKWECPCCDLIIRSTKEVNVICGDCEVQLIKSF